MNQTNSEQTQTLVACHITITGVVQGVGFRPFVYNLAQSLGLKGWVLNHSGGVDIAIEGAMPAAQQFIHAVKADAPPLARIMSLEAQPVPPQHYADFEIRHSEKQAGDYQLISPDVATCLDCVRELFDRADRRYRYPFINCTNCGPRFTIIQDIPYDRPNTTMHVFPLCDDCRAEYENPTDRRFHAQPNACPVCGPELWISESTHHAVIQSPHDSSTEATLAYAKKLLLDGQILAIKGLGGFHLACDATNAETVQRLRDRKHRPHKPFALMVATLDDARALCHISKAEEKLLTSSQCPIVLLEQKSAGHEQQAVSATVAPNQHTLGVMLPYTPLHHILLRDVGRPLVMTSGNLTEEPIAKDNAEALRRLAPLADAFLLHNRDIYARYDDSVVQMAHSKSQDLNLNSPQFLRRARGYAPFPVRLPFKIPKTFAAGPLLKNTFTLTRDDYAFVSQHIGDMENVDTLAHYEAALETYQHLFRIAPEQVVCDMHPDYLTTRLAKAYAQEHNLPAPRQVQHHQAHIASCLVDNGWTPNDGPVIGVAFDGTGYGEDGTIWGSEWFVGPTNFVGNFTRFERVAHLDYLPLPGGDTATREPWRIAVAYLLDLFGDEGLPVGMFCPSDTLMLRQQVTRRINTTDTSSMGRLFDAVSALLGICEKTSYEAQAAIELEQLTWTAKPDKLAPYPYDIAFHSGIRRIQLNTFFDALLTDIEQDVNPAYIAWHFHATIADLIVRICEQIRDETGITTVALSGGVFQNQRLQHLTVPQMRAAGFRVLLHQHVPCNDGGISLGQAIMAHWE